MGQSLTSRYAEVIQRSFATPAAWSWPRDRKAGEPGPDSRLTGKHLPGLSTVVTLANGSRVETMLRAVANHDLVLAGPDVAAIPVMGQVIDIVVRWSKFNIVIHSQAIVHWSGNISGQDVVAVFTTESMQAAAECLTHLDVRGEVRFPLSLPAAVEVTKGKDVFGHIADYSLSGCSFVAEEAIELDLDYPMTVLMPNSSVQMTLRPRWVLNSEGGCQLGCTFAPEEGVLLACRHHPQPTGLSSALRPQTTNWNAQDETDLWS